MFIYTSTDEIINVDNLIKIERSNKQVKFSMVDSTVISENYTTVEAAQARYTALIDTINTAELFLSDQNQIQEYVPEPEVSDEFIDVPPLGPANPEDQ